MRLRASSSSPWEPKVHICGFWFGVTRWTRSVTYPTSSVRPTHPSPSRSASPASSPSTTALVNTEAVGRIRRELSALEGVLHRAGRRHDDPATSATDLPPDPRRRPGPAPHPPRERPCRAGTRRRSNNPGTRAIRWARLSAICRLTKSAATAVEANRVGLVSATARNSSPAAFFNPVAGEVQHQQVLRRPVREEVLDGEPDLLGRQRCAGPVRRSLRRPGLASTSASAAASCAGATRRRRPGSSYWSFVDQPARYVSRPRQVSVAARLRTSGRRPVAAGQCRWHRSARWCRRRS